MHAANGSSVHIERGEGQRFGRRRLGGTGGRGWLHRRHLVLGRIRCRGCLGREYESRQRVAFDVYGNVCVAMGGWGVEECGVQHVKEVFGFPG